MGSILSDHQINIDSYMQMLYTNPMLTTIQKQVRDMQKIKRKKYITKESQKIMRREQEKKGSEKK